jgi:glycosyltransferase 2 family protein
MLGSTAFSSGTWLRKNAFVLIASLVFAGGIAWILQSNSLHIIPKSEDFAKLNWWAVPAYALIWSFVLFVRSARWVYLLAPIRKVPVRRAVTVSFLGFAALVLLPFRMGEVVRPALIREKDKLSAWEATGTVGAERIIDGLVLTLLLLIALSVSTPLDPLPKSIGELEIPVAMVPTITYAAVLLFVVAFSTMLVFYFFRDFARRTTRAIVGIVSERFADRLADTVERVAAGLGFLPQLRFTLPFLFWTLVYWFANASGVWLLMRGAGVPDVGFEEACVVMGTLALGILAPNPPGFFGFFQLSLFTGMALYVPVASVLREGTVFIFLLYVLQIGLTVLAGVGALLVDRIFPYAAPETDAPAAQVLAGEHRSES